MDDYVLAKGVVYDMDDDANFMDNTQICRGYGNFITNRFRGQL